MGYSIQGTYYAPCSCDVACPCLFGELDGDRGWCSGIIALDIKSGNSNGVDLAGTQVVGVADWPRGFLAGEGVGRVYISSGASAEQRAALESMIQGKEGGTLEALGQLIPKFLETREANIEITADKDEARIAVGDIGQAVLTPLRGPSGEITRVLHGAAAFRDDTVLAKTSGGFKDPELRDWESGGHGEYADFDWSS
ncbi:MAG: DUF1326 domain-containing protein [Actinomycetota bacterium]|nr:DUF1326 domain-containing protein [Actinomycetota bacterium]